MNTSITTLRIGASLILALSGAAHANDLPAPADLPPLAAVEQALASQPLVKAAQAQVRGAQAELQRLRAGEYEYGLNLSTQRRSISGGPDHTEWGVGIERGLRLPGKAALDARIGQQGVLAAEEAIGDARHESARQLLSLWYATRQAGLEASLWRKQAELLQAQKRGIELGSNAAMPPVSRFCKPTRQPHRQPPRPLPHRRGNGLRWPNSRPATRNCRRRKPSPPPLLRRQAMRRTGCNARWHTTMNCSRRSARWTRRGCKSNARRPTVARTRRWACIWPASKAATTASSVSVCRCHCLALRAKRRPTSSWRRRKRWRNWKPPRDDGLPPNRQPTGNAPLAAWNPGSAGRGRQRHRPACRSGETRARPRRAESVRHAAGATRGTGSATGRRPGPPERQRSPGPPAARCPPTLAPERT
jgi:hypothetical protein